MKILYGYLSEYAVAMYSYITIHICLHALCVYIYTQIAKCM